MKAFFSLLHKLQNWSNKGYFFLYDFLSKLTIWFIRGKFKTRAIFTLRHQVVGKLHQLMQMHYGSHAIINLRLLYSIKNDKEESLHSASRCYLCMVVSFESTFKKMRHPLDHVCNEMEKKSKTSCIYLVKSFNSMAFISVIEYSKNEESKKELGVKFWSCR